MSEWIKCSERMPDVDQKVLIAIPVCGYHEVEGANYKGDGVFHGAWCQSRGKGKCYKVRYWMPFRAFPEGVK